MDEKVEISQINCAGREAIIADTLCNSNKYRVKLNVFGSFRNPLLDRLSKKSGGNYYIVDVNDERNFPDMVEKCAGSDIVFIGNETPIIKNLGGMLRHEYGEDVGVIGPSSKPALEKSKYDTRLIIDEVCPEANPEYYFIEPKKIGWERYVRKAVNTLNGKVAIKPIEPKFGKGVIVEGFDFAAGEAYQKAIETAKAGNFLIEEKIIGQEWSGQYAVDSKLHVWPFPAVRDFKRADEKGPNTGGVACVKGEEDILPFMKKKEFDEGARISKKIKRKLAQADGYEDGSQTGIFYPAYILNGIGNSVLEFNDRFGDGEVLAVLPALKNDFVDVCFGMVVGNIPRLEFENQAVGMLYAFPLTYGGYLKNYSGDKTIRWNENNFSPQTRAYPASIDLKGSGEMQIMKSRSIAVVCKAPFLEEALEVVNQDIKNIDGPVRYKTGVDIDYFRKCGEEMKMLRKTARENRN
ncbi:MAG: hypothetical protein WA139_00260 [Candidatus Aenigmatarchaeota archaeon]